MSTSLKINRPAWPGIRPGDKDFSYPVSKDIRLWILRTLKRYYFPGLDDISECLSSSAIDHRYPTGHFLVRATSNGEDLCFFARIALRWGARERGMIYGITEYLYNFGCPVQRWFLRTDTETPYFVDNSNFEKPVQFTVYPFTKMSIIKPERGILEKAGLAVAKLHVALKNIPFSDEIRNNSFKRTRELERTKNLVQKAIDTRAPGPFGQRFTWILKNDGYIKRLLKNFDPFFGIWSDTEPQVIHGDMNAGNVLRVGKGDVIILDFEDTRHSFYPRWVDIALALERLAMFDRPQSDALLRRIGAFLKGYKSHSASPFSSLGMSWGRQLVEMLCQINYYATCLLLTLCRQGEEDFGDREWNKFRALEKQALNYAETIENMRIG